MKPSNWTSLEQIDPTLSGLVAYIKTQEPNSKASSKSGWIADYLQATYHLDSVHWWSSRGLTVNISRVWRDNEGCHEEEADIDLPDELDNFARLDRYASLTAEQAIAAAQE